MHGVVIHFVAFLYIGFPAQIKKQKSGAFAGLGVGNKLTKKVYPAPVRSLFFGLPYIISLVQ
jgi:hypothetical protein